MFSGLASGYVVSVIQSNIFPFQPMEIYVDDEAKLTLHGLVQVLAPLPIFH